MPDVNSYYVSVNTPNGIKTAILAPANQNDMPDSWDFSWSNLWYNTDFECQSIIKLTYESSLWGLMRYSVFPIDDNQNMIVEVEHLETHPESRDQIKRRPVKPVGKWLIWYAVQVALQYHGEPNDTLLTLASLPDAFDYYQNVLQMEYLGIAPSAPGEDAYGFRFTREKGTNFCRRQERELGFPRRLDPRSS